MAFPDGYGQRKKTINGQGKRDAHLCPQSAPVTPVGATDEMVSCAESASPITPYHRSIQGTEILVRDMKESEVPWVHSVYKKYANDGMGYSVSEIGEHEHFREAFLVNNIAIVMENEINQETLYASIIRPAWKFLRHPKKVAVSTMTVANPDMQHSRPTLPVLVTLNKLCIDIAQSKGYKFGIYTTPLSNQRVLRFVIGRVPTTVLGTLPNGIHLRGQGYDDLVFYTGEHDDRDIV